MTDVMFKNLYHVPGEHPLSIDRNLYSYSEIGELVEQ